MVSESVYDIGVGVSAELDVLFYLAGGLSLVYGFQYLDGLLVAGSPCHFYSSL